MYRVKPLPNPETLNPKPKALVQGPCKVPENLGKPCDSGLGPLGPGG